MTTTEFKEPNAEAQLAAGDSDAAEKSSQDGVLQVQYAHSRWTKRGVTIAYCMLFVTSFIIYLEIYSTGTYIPFATSDFASHSLLAAAGTVQNIVDVAAYPTMAKMSDVFGRAPGIALSVLFLALSNALSAASRNIDTFVAAGTFDAAGNAGYAIMIQVFIADTTRLLNRGIWASLIEAVCIIPVLYLGTIIGESVLTHSTWRWGYGMWSIIMPVASIPLITVMYHYQKGSRAQKVRSTRTLPQKALHICNKLDVVGALLLVAALCLILIPLSITGPFNPQRWGNASTIAMIVVGVVLLALFILWDVKFAKYPFLSFGTIREKTILAAFALALINWIQWATQATFLSSYFQVAAGMSPGQAVRIDNAGRVSFQIFSVVCGLAMRWLKRPQPLVLAGVPLAILSQGIMIYLVNIDGARPANEASFIASRVVAGIGQGFFLTAAQVSCQALVSLDNVAIVTGLFYSMLSIGSAIGRSVAGAIWNETLPRRLLENLPAGDQEAVPIIFSSFVAAMEYPVGEPTRDAVNQSYRQTVQLLAIIATAVSAVLLAPLLVMKNINLEEYDAKREAGMRVSDDATPQEQHQP